MRALRAGFRHWPYMHGRGWLLRLARLLYGRRPMRFDIGGGTFIDGALDDWIVIWTFMRQHERDKPFQRSFDLLGPGSIAIDVGANLGIWSLLAARRGASVHAFEPVPGISERFQRHLDLNGVGSVTVNRLALGAEAGSLPFFAAPTINTGASSLARPLTPHVEIRVPVVTLDSYIEREGIERIDLMKVDVEGAEILVFRGARRLLSSDRAPIIFFETGEPLCGRFGVTTRDVKQLLAGYGYGIYRWRKSLFQPVTLEERHEREEDLFALKS